MIGFCARRGGSIAGGILVNSSRGLASGGEIRRVTLIPGDGIGPEISDAVRQVCRSIAALRE